MPKVAYSVGAGCLFFIVGIVIGWLAWGGGPELARLGWILVLPLAWGRARSRMEAALLIAGYYLAGARGLPVGAIVFFGEGAPAWFGWCLWFAANLLLTAPFAVLWSGQGRARPWRFVAAVCVSAIPPLAIIGWLNPLTVAGMMYPGLGWAGLFLTLASMAALAAINVRAIACLAVLALVANGIAGLSPLRPPAGWEGFDTSFPRLSSAGAADASQLLAGMRRVQWLVQVEKYVPSHSVLVLPETVVGSFDGVAELSLQETEAALAARGSRILVGAELPQRNGQYKNVVLVLGAKAGEDRAAVQSIPIPVAMWKPWATDGAAADFLGRGNTVMVNGVRVGTAVCYEQVLAYSLWRLMVDKPDLLVAVSNVWWARTTSIPTIQQQSVNAFGRLFGVAVVAARNF